MAVDVASAFVGGIVQVNRAQLVKADGAIELFQDAVQVVHDIVALGPHGGRVEADAHVVGKINLLDNGGQLLEVAAHLGALAGHGVQQHGDLLAGGKHLVQRVGHVLDALVDANVQAAAGAHQVQTAVHLGQAGHILGVHHEGEVALVHFVRGGVGVVGSIA